MKKRNYNVFFIVICILIIGVVQFMIVYVVFSATLNALFGNLTQSALIWDVGFQDGGVIWESFGTN